MELNHQNSQQLRAHLPCPFCNSSDAYAEYSDGHGFCFSCEAYSAPKLQVGEDEGFSFEYIPYSSISERTLRFYNTLTKIDNNGKPVSLQYRYPNGDIQVRRLDKKEFYWIKSDNKEPHGLFGRDKFPAGSHDCIVITEGAKDAQSLWQVLSVPCVSVVSSSSAVSDCVVDRSYLNSYKEIYLCFDTDTSGREAVSRVAKLFDYDKVYDFKLVRKDANEHLQEGEVSLLRDLFHKAKRYIPESIICNLDDFDKILSEEPVRGISYPFKTLDDKTQGIRLGEAILITAMEGVGKTEIMHALEYSILTQTDSNVAAIFNEEIPKRHCEAISGIHLERAVHLPNSGCTRPEVIQAFREVVKEDGRFHLYLNFGSDDPEILLDTIRFLAVARSCRYILLDHISMVVSGLSESDERRSLDKISTKLERLVKECNISLIVVSHVNDEGQTRGSRYISKVFDVRIDCARNILGHDPVDQRTIKLTISKNRPTWKTGDAGSYVFDPMTNTYEEVDDVSPSRADGHNNQDTQGQGSSYGGNSPGDILAF